MSLSEPLEPMPLGLAVLVEELRRLDREFEMLDRALEDGAKQARVQDLLTALDRYLRLEAEVFFPVFERAGQALAADCSRHQTGLKVAMAAFEARDGRQANPQRIDALRCAFGAYRDCQERSTFPRAARTLGSALEEIGYELNQARQRMKGTYGV